MKEIHADMLWMKWGLLAPQNHFHHNHASGWSLKLALRNPSGASLTTTGLAQPLLFYR